MTGEVEEPLRPGVLVGILASGVALGGLAGAMTNAVNGAVSPLYFVRILRRRNAEDVGRAAVAQGIFEGLLFGAAFSLLLSAMIGWVSHCRCRFGTASRFLFGTFAGDLAAWVAGGALALGLAWISLEFYRNLHPAVPEAYAEMMRFAWVGGSIYGIEIGGLAATVVSAVIFRAASRKRESGPERWIPSPPGPTRAAR